MTMFAIKFELADDVVIVCSGEIGTVVGRWESINSAPRYLVRYRASDGRACEIWWDQDALVAPIDEVAKAKDPTAGGAVDRTVAAPPQDVGDGIPF
jgi:hypothetical protein